MKTKHVYFFYTILFFILALTALNFNYIEGDDAATVLHHALGRDRALQPIYSPYHSMLDTILSLIPSQNEITLRYVSIGASFLSGFIVLIFMARILIEEFSEHKVRLLYFLLALPFIIPDVLFNSLLINSANISFVILLLSHILFNKYLNNKSYLYLVYSILLFGFGVSFRWNNGFYLFVLFGVFILNFNENSKDLHLISQLKKSFFIFPFFVLSVIGFIQISGYSVYDIAMVYKSGSSYLEESNFSILAMAASAISFTTPAYLALFVLGVISCIKHKKYLPIYLLILAIIPYLYLGLYPYYKYLICLILPIIFIQVYGFLSLKHKAIKIVLVCLIFLPWIFGLQIQSSSAWGPGFEVRSITNNSLIETNFNPDKSTSINDVTIALGSGMAMPTPEGPRPLFGFGKVLLEDWYHFVATINIERESSVNYAIENKCNILQDVNHGFISSKLAEYGYGTDYEFNALGEYGIHRIFNKETDSVSIDVFKDKKALFNTQQINSYLSKQKNKKVVIYSTYTNILTKLRSKYKNQFEQQGAFWGILTLNE